MLEVRLCDHFAMARITDARLRAEGEGTAAVLTLELRLDWDRGDDDHRWEVVVRFRGADTGLRGGDDTVKVHTVPVAPGDGEDVTVTVDNADGAFDEDRGGGDEVYAECELRILQADTDVVRSNKVKGRF